MVTVELLVVVREKSEHWETLDYYSFDWMDVDDLMRDWFREHMIGSYVAAWDRSVSYHRSYSRGLRAVFGRFNQRIITTYPTETIISGLKFLLEQGYREQLSHVCERVVSIKADIEWTD
jgi:hypothetical protein